MTTGPSGVVALVVTRGATAFLETTLGAVADQTFPPDHLVIVDVEARDVPRLREAAATSTGLSDLLSGAVLVDGGRARTLGAAVRRAVEDPEAGPVLSVAQRWWILHDDSAPEATCLGEQWEVADRGRTVAAVGPKQIDWDGLGLLEVGILATRSAQRLLSIAPGEIDQGQYDNRADVLAVGTAGMLVDRQVWEDLGGTDPVLGPFGDGLEFGRRVRRAGKRVVVAPRAHLRHARNSLTHDSYRGRRFAQMYNWCVAVEWWQLPLLALAFLMWTPTRAIGRIVTGASELAVDELAAWGRVILSTPGLVRARLRVHRQASLPASVLHPLEVRPAEIGAQRRLARRIKRSEKREIAGDPLVLSSARRHMWRSRATGISMVGLLLIGAVVVWSGETSGLTGAAWGQAPSRWSDLWAAAWSTWIPGGDGRVGPADPVLIPLAILSAPFAATGISASTVWTWLLVLTIPLSAASAWVLACRLTTSIPVRGATALAWASVPAVTIAASQGRLAACLAHILLPLVLVGWAAMVGSRPALVAAGAEGPVEVVSPAHRAGAAGIAVLSLAGVVAAVPWLLAAAWLVLVLVAPVLRRRVYGLLLTTVPAAIVVAPFVVTAMTVPGGWAALMTPGGPALAGDAPASWEVVLGIPQTVSWMPPLWAFVPLGGALLLAALVAIVSGRPSLLGTILPIAIAVLALAGALLLGRLEVAATPDVAHAWAGPALSVATLALLVVIDRATVSAGPWDRGGLHPERIGSGVVGATALLALGGWAVCGPLGAPATDHVSAGAAREIPAVSEQAELLERAGRVLVLSRDEDGLTARVLRSQGVSLTDATALTRLDRLSVLRAGAPDRASSDLAQAALTLTVAPDDSTVVDLADHDIDTVLVPDPESFDGAALSEVLDRASGLERVGDTDSGRLWRVRPESGLPARVRLQTADGSGGWTPVAAGMLGVGADLPEGASGTLVLAERADGDWHASVDGHRLEVVADPAASEGVASGDGSSVAWRQAFAVTSGGHLVISHSPWWGLPWRILAMLGLCAAVLGALPVRRRG